MDHKIEKGVPIPPASNSPKYITVLRKLDVGDSVLLEASANSLSWSMARLHPKKFTQRKVRGGQRVWRVE